MNHAPNHAAPGGAGLPAASPSARDWRAALAAADLPPILADLVGDVVQRSRLWRAEKSDLARELAAHFADGLAAGRTPEELAMTFGDPAQAALLTRRARKRARPAAYRAFVHTSQGIGALLVAALIVYIVLAYRYYAGEPVIKRRYAAEYNAAIEQIPEDQRAYEIYLRAWALVPAKPDSMLNAWPAFAPEHPAYPDALAYLDRVRPAIDLLHQAAARPHLGAPISNAIDPRLVAIFEARNPDFDSESEPPPMADPPLATILLPVLAEYRESARLLTFDAHEAARRSDAELALRDLHAMLGMAEQMARQPTLISQLVGLAIHALTMQTGAQIIHHHPRLFSDAQLRDLAHRSAAYMDGRPRVDLSGERHNFDDAIQRVYSDDGHGNGYITAQGLANLITMFDAGMPTPKLLDTPIGPLAAALVADRASMTAKFEELMTRLEQDAQLPMWRYDELSGTEALIERMADSEITKARYLPVVILFPALNNAVRAAEQTVQRRDAFLTGIALELFHRRHARYPASLAQLVPEFLPAAPLDRFTGQPLNYAVIDGTPRLWSVGADRKDDHGRAPPAEKDMTSRWIPAAEIPAKLADPQAGPCYDGDWVLWPVEYRPFITDP